MSHRSRRSFRHSLDPAATLAVLARGAGNDTRRPAQAKPLGPCDGPCTQTSPPSAATAKPKLVTVYRSTFAYSTPYLNARSRHPGSPTTYVATCEAYSSSAGPYQLAIARSLGRYASTQG